MKQAYWNSSYPARKGNFKWKKNSALLKMRLGKQSRGSLGSTQTHSPPI
jgi:hypothetical protein